MTTQAIGDKFPTKETLAADAAEARHIEIVYVQSLVIGPDRPIPYRLAEAAWAISGEPSCLPS
jgi:hypothetical protein